MPWSNQGGGPWGQKPGGDGSGRGGPTPPNVEEMLRRGQERVRRFLPGGGGNVRVLGIGVLVVIVFWLLSGFYRVDTTEQGIELLFGEWNGVVTDPGLHYWFPAPIGHVERPNVTSVRRLELGFQTITTRGTSVDRRDIPQESLMLTADQNIADLDFFILWRVADAGDFVFKIRDQDETVKAVAESAMREIVGQTLLEPLLTNERAEVAQKSKDLMQQILDEYEAGIFIQEVQLENAKPPEPVADAFEDVQAAEQDKEKAQNEADAYRNRIIPTARGQAARMVQDANAYKERVTKEAEGEGQRFISIYETYRNAKEVTRRRLYLEAMREVMVNSNKVIIDQNQQGVVPYLPLTEIQRRNSGAGGQ